MKQVINNSTNEHFKGYYQKLAERVAKEFPDYQVSVDGGGYRFHDVQYKINTTEKTIELDFYMPLYIDGDECVKWVIDEIREKYLKAE